MDLIYLKDFLKAFRLTDLNVFWEPYRCKITRKGIRQVKDIDSTHLVEDELLNLVEASHDLEIQFPCSKPDLYRWAVRNSFIYEFNKYFGEYVSQPLPPESQTLIGGENRKSEKQRTRKTNLKRAIEDVVKEKGRKPSFEELWQYFQDGKDKTGYIVDYTDDKITWEDTRGKLHDALRRSIANNLSRIKV